MSQRFPERQVNAPRVADSSQFLPPNDSHRMFDPNYADPSVTKYSHAQLAVKYSTGRLPADVDPRNKEAYLTAVEFSSVFQMDFDTFRSLPTWKKQNMKSKHGLF